MGDLCAVCRHRPPTQGSVCDTDAQRMSEQLSALPDRVRALTLQLVPGQAADGQRIAATRTGSPTGARLAALTLVGPGSDGLSDAAVAAMMHPAVRRWRTVTTVTVLVDTPDGPAEQEREVVTWNQDVLVDDHGQTLHVAADDQVGILPPAEWLDSWVRSWRQHFGHRTRPVPSAHLASANPDSASARQYAIQVLLGLLPGHCGAATLGPDDPIAEEWQIRWGEPDVDAALRADVMYLHTWLPAACEQDVGIADFAAELRALTAELLRVLGEQPNEQWLGRCPAPLTDRTTGKTRPCGAGLWQDPYAPQVACPRCRSTWGPGKTALLYLAQKIRRAWPIDRRRRYNADEIEAIGARRPLRCPVCTEPVDIIWRDATGVGDPRRTWRPAKALCPAGCPSARRLI